MERERPAQSGYKMKLLNVVINMITYYYYYKHAHPYDLKLMRTQTHQLVLMW